MKVKYLKNSMVVIKEGSNVNHTITTLELYCNLKSGRAFLVCSAWNLDSLKAIKNKSYLNSKKFNPLFCIREGLKVKTIEEAQVLFILSSKINNGSIVNKSFKAFKEKDFFELMRLEREYLGEKNV